MSSPPPPPPGSVPPPPPGGAVPPPAWSGPPAGGYDLGPAGKPARPKVPVGGWLTVVGAAVLLLSSFLPWLKVRGETLNGLDDFLVDSDGDLKILEGPGRFWIFFAIVLAALGVALLMAGRVLAVAIIGIVCAGLALFFVLGGWGAASDSKDFVGEGSYGFGLVLGTIGAFVALGGTIVATARRRR